MPGKRTLRANSPGAKGAGAPIKSQRSKPARKAQGADGDAIQFADRPFPIVGVGASAGGLDALTALLNGLPVNTGMAFVLVQHMAPTRESILNKLLERATGMPVAQVTDGMLVEPNRVYVIPPNTSMSVRRRALRLESRPTGAGRQAPIERVRPNQTVENKIDGVLIAVADIDALKRNLEQATESRSVTQAEREEALDSLRTSEGALRRSQQQLRSLAGKLLSSEEERNRRLTLQLREDFNQRLAALGLDLSSVEKELESASARKRLRRMQDQVSALSRDVANTADRLHPSGVDLLGLVSTIRDECREFSRRERISVKVNQRKVPEAIPREVGLCLLRVVQESLSNVARHAKAESVRVGLSGHPGKLRLTIKDDGVGFDPASGGNGLGLISLQERVRTLNGELSVHSTPGKGTELVAEVPLPPTRRAGE